MIKFCVEHFFDYAIQPFWHVSLLLLMCSTLDSDEISTAADAVSYGWAAEHGVAVHWHNVAPRDGDESVSQS